MIHPDLPAPLIAADVHLDGVPYMPLLVDRLLSSEFDRIANDREWRAGVTAWCRAWQETPAGSLPSDDASLAKLMGFGREIAAWKKVKANALRGFVLCSDGRLYHPLICEQAAKVWKQRVEWRRLKAAQRGRPPQPDQDAGATAVAAASTGTSRRTKRAVHQDVHLDNQKCPPGQDELSTRTSVDVPVDRGGLSSGTGPLRYSKEEGEVERTSSNTQSLAGEFPDSHPRAGARAPASSLAEFAFAGAVIRMTWRDFAKWVEAFRHIDLRAELTSRDDYLASLPPGDRRRQDWFLPTSNWLARRNADAARYRRNVDDGYERGVLH